MAVTPGLASKLQAVISATPTDIAGVVSISYSGLSMGTVETTNLASSAKTYRSTIADGGEISAEIQYDPAAATHAFLTTTLLAGTIQDWKIVLADTGACVFAAPAFVTGFDLNGLDIEGNVTASLKLKVNGVPTITP